MQNLGMHKNMGYKYVRTFSQKRNLELSYYSIRIENYNLKDLFKLWRSFLKLISRGCIHFLKMKLSFLLKHIQRKYIAFTQYM